VFQDAARIWGVERPKLARLAGACFGDVGMAAVVLFRLAQRIHRRGHPVLSTLFTRLNLALHGCYIDVGAEIGPGFRLAHPWGVAVGKGVRAGTDLVLFQNVSIAARSYGGSDFPTLGDRVIIFANSVVVGSVRLGDDCRVGACSLVLHDVGAGVTAADRIYRQSVSREGRREEGWQSRPSGD
jgi:serine O-acetyltransferase